MSDNQKKVIIFGGTGHAGKYILHRAIEEDGVTVTAFVRTPLKLPEKIREKINVVKGNVLDEESVGNAIANHDAVLSALGNGLQLSHTTLMSDGTRNIVSGMKKHGVKKLVVICGGGSLPNYWMPWFIQNVVQDHRRVLDVLKKDSDNIDWVSLHPPLIKPSTKIHSNYTLEKNDLTGQIFVTAGEIADFMMKYVKKEDIHEEYKHSSVGISSGPAYISSFGLKMLLFSIILLVVALFLYYIIG